MIVLVGFMGAGKSTIGRALAERLGLPFVDTDDEIQASSGMSIPDLFAAGEGRFRALERDVVAKALERRVGVVALGGGALGDPATCAELEWATVVHLDVSYQSALARAAASEERPMLSIADPKALFDDRNEIYRRVSDVTVTTTDRSPDEVVAELVDLLGEKSRSDPTGADTIDVQLGPRSYPVIVGAGLTEEIASYLPGSGKAEVAAILTHPELAAPAERLRVGLERGGVRAETIEIASGEASKSLATAQTVFDRLAEIGVHHNDILVGLGGGVITDLAGFVASTYHRGISVVHVPTTLLAQVDAAIGGKTGVNLQRGKNLVGTFHQPIAVLCDVRHLRSLPDEEFRSGAAEVVKYGFIAEPTLLDWVIDNRDALAARDETALRAVVARCARIKAAFVAADERDQGRRAHLNYGHTFGHAIEHARAGRIRHGEAVALGMMAAAHLAHELGRIGEADVLRHREVLERLGLPVRATFDIGELEGFWLQDKKFDRGVRFVLLARVGVAEAGIEAPREAIVAALTRMAA